MCTKMTVFPVLKDYERVLDELGLYVYDNWEDGELVEGPIIGRHFVQCSVYENHAIKCLIQWVVKDY